MWYSIKDKIDEAIAKAKKNNIIAVLLVGSSDLEFIVEHSCLHHGLSFLKAADPDIASRMLKENMLAVYSESAPLTEIAVTGNALYLSRMVLAKSADNSEGNGPA
jgi:hypothetical protein